MGVIQGAVCDPVRCGLGVAVAPCAVHHHHPSLLAAVVVYLFDVLRHECYEIRLGGFQLGLGCDGGTCGACWREVCQGGLTSMARCS